MERDCYRSCSFGCYNIIVVVDVVEEKDAVIIAAIVVVLLFECSYEL